jgi:hypothetical protein
LNDLERTLASRKTSIIVEARRRLQERQITLQVAAEVSNELPEPAELDDLPSEEILSPEVVSSEPAKEQLALISDLSAPTETEPVIQAYSPPVENDNTLVSSVLDNANLPVIGAIIGGGAILLSLSTLWRRNA